MRALRRSSFTSLHEHDTAFHEDEDPGPAAAREVAGSGEDLEQHLRGQPAEEGGGEAAEDGARGAGASEGGCRGGEDPVGPAQGHHRPPLGGGGGRDSGPCEAPTSCFTKSRSPKGSLFERVRPKGGSREELPQQDDALRRDRGARGADVAAGRAPKAARNSVETSLWK